MKKTIGNYELTECTAIAIDSGDTTRQEAIFIHDITDEFSDGDGVLFGYNLKGIETAEDLIDIFGNDQFAYDTDWETLDTVEITRYDIVENEATTDDKREIKEGFTLARDNQSPEIIDYYFSKDEALEHLKKYKSSVRCTAGRYDHYYYVTEYYVQENVYNLRDEWLNGGDVWEFAKMEGDF